MATALVVPQLGEGEEGRRPLSGLPACPGRDDKSRQIPGKMLKFGHGPLDLSDLTNRRGLQSQSTLSRLCYAGHRRPKRGLRATGGRLLGQGKIGKLLCFWGNHLLGELGEEIWKVAQVDLVTKIPLGGSRRETLGPLQGPHVAEVEAVLIGADNCTL